MVHLVLLRSLLYMQSREDKRRARLKKRIKQKQIMKKITLCRICNKHRGVIPIFNDTLQINIAQEIQTLSGIVIQTSDKKSKFICKKCLERLDSCIHFRELCRKNNQFVQTIASEDISQKIVSDNGPPSDNEITESNNEEQPEEHYSLPSPTFSEEFKFYYCPNCEQPFPELEKYNLHVLTCNGQPETKDTEPEQKRRFLCDVCGKTISTLATLHIHMKIHKDVFPYYCDECTYRGRTVDLLRVHKRIHLTEKPYKCDLCPKTATTASNLQRHVRNAHSTSRPFKCTHCDRNYRLQRDVNKHIKEVHSRQMTANCPLCDKTLSSLNALSKHRLKVHKIKGRNGRMPSYLQCEMANQDIEEYT